jgi:PadR family transcriptional regulator PadR
VNIGGIFKEGTLYPALHKLEAEGLVESFWQASPSGPRRRYYRLTPAGEAWRARADPNVRA